MSDKRDRIFMQGGAPMEANRKTHDEDEQNADGGAAAGGRAYGLRQREAVPGMAEGPDGEEQRQLEAGARPVEARA